VYGLKRISAVYGAADRIIINDDSKIVLMSDCHRGDGSHADTFSKNKNIYYAALTRYYQEDFVYIELGDGDELWENKNMKDIIYVHKDVYALLFSFYQKNRLHMLYGNHDIDKRRRQYLENNLYQYFDTRKGEKIPLFPNIKIYEGLVLLHKPNNREIFLLHGHQADFLNGCLWRLAKVLVRYLWRPLELFGVNDPTSTAKNYKRKKSVEDKLIKWLSDKDIIIIAGHTHRPVFPDTNEPRYFNDGSCVHPRCITAVEINKGYITLVKWSVKTKPDGTLYIGRDELAGPARLSDYYRGGTYHINIT